MVSSHLVAAAAVLWTLTSTFIANASATLPRGRGAPLDFGKNWPWDGRRVFGASKTWSGLLFGTFFALPFGLLQAWLILVAPPDLQLVPKFGPTFWGSFPVVLLLCGGPLLGDALGSFLKRRLDRPSGSRALWLDQLPFVLVPVVVGLLLFPAVFVTVFANPEGILWLVLFTLGFHAAFNWLGFKIGTKTVPW